MTNAQRELRRLSNVELYEMLEQADCADNATMVRDELERRRRYYLVRSLTPTGG